MKKDLQEILKTITPKTSLDEVASFCDNVDDLMEILNNLPFEGKNEIYLDAYTLQCAEKIYINLERKIDITVDKETVFFQKVLHLTYPQASRLVTLMQQKYNADKVPAQATENSQVDAPKNSTAEAIETTNKDEN